MIVPGSANPVMWGSPDPIDELGVISRALRCRNGVPGYLTRTPTVAGNRKTWTFNAWIKRTKLAPGGSLLCSNNGGNQAYSNLTFDGNDKIYYLEGTTIPSNPLLTTSNAQFRDVSSHINVHVMFDTTNAAASQRFRVFINGAEIAMNNAATLALNYDSNMNNTQLHALCANPVVGGSYLDCVLSNVCLVDGQALLPTAFGKFHPLTGQWRPKTAAAIRSSVVAGGGSRNGWGTNGFFLPFNDPTNTTSIGYDRSQSDTDTNGNNWTTNGISLTAGTTYDSSYDTPTREHCTLSLLNKGNVTLSDAMSNIFAGSVTAGWGSSIGTMPLASGKWYFEATVTAVNTGGSVGTLAMLGVCTDTARLNSNSTSAVGDSGYGWGYGVGTIAPIKRYNGSNTTLGAGSIALNDVLMCAVDVDAGKVWFGRNGAWAEGDPASGTTPSFTGLTGPLAIMLSSYYDAAPNAAVALNSGQRNYSYTAPSGFKAPCKKNIPKPIGQALINPKYAFDTIIYTGDGNATKAVTGSLFSPDLAWVKNRSASSDHSLYDTVRGATKRLRSNQTAAENTEGMQSLDANGFTVNNTGGVTNVNGNTYAAWLWKANGAAVANNAGSIATQVSANQQIGMSIVSYTGNGANATIGHGLGVAPKMVIAKRRTDAAGNWCVLHQAANSGNGHAGRVVLNTTAAFAASSNYWNNLAPTSSVVNLGAGADDVNGNGVACIAYCFAEVTGFSKFGLFTGNGSSDGPFVNCGFRPRWIMIKRTDTTGSWVILDTARETENPEDYALYSNLPDAETWMSAGGLDVTSNGFKLRGTDTNANANGGIYIYAAFAEFPFRYANAR